LKELLKLRFNEKQIEKLLFATQGVGLVFVSIFLAAYLGGLPSTNVLHSEPAFRIPLIIFGILLLILVLAAIVLTAAQRKK